MSQINQQVLSMNGVFLQVTCLQKYFQFQKDEVHSQGDDVCVGSLDSDT